MSRQTLPCASRQIFVAVIESIAFSSQKTLPLEDRLEDDILVAEEQAMVLEVLRLEEVAEEVPLPSQEAAVVVDDQTF